MYVFGWRSLADCHGGMTDENGIYKVVWPENRLSMTGYLKENVAAGGIVNHCGTNIILFQDL